VGGVGGVFKSMTVLVTHLLMIKVHICRIAVVRSKGACLLYRAIWRVCGGEGGGGQYNFAWQFAHARTRTDVHGRARARPLQLALAADTMHGVTVGNSPVMPTPIFSQQQPCLQAAAFKSSSSQHNASSLVRLRPSCHSFILNLCVRTVVWCVLGVAEWVKTSDVRN
jgi:hypothetical protein